MKQKINITPKQIKDIDSQYKYEFDIMADDIEAQKAKWALQQLEIPDRIIFELYCEYQSLRKVGAILGVTANIVLREIKRIRKQIIELMEECNEV